MTPIVAAPKAPTRGVRRAPWALVSCVWLAACGSDVGDLFSAPPSEPPASNSESPSVEAPLAEPASPSPEAPPTVADGVDVEPAPSEASAPPIALDDGATRADEDPVSESPLPPPPEETAPVDEGAAPPVEAPVEPAPPPAGDDGATDVARLCAPIEAPLLLDFESVGDDTTQAIFGDFEAELSGGTYVYPQLSLIGPGAAPRGLVSDVAEGDWHISGSVIEQSGFGVFLDCQLLDASRFVGLAFSISGNVGNADTVTLLVGTASNDVSSEWLVANGGDPEPRSGRCTPARNEYDGSCNQARVEVPVSAQTREIVVPFSALGGGSPERGVNPAELTTLGWALPMPGTNALGNTQPYAVDLRIDDIRFVEAAALRPAPGRAVSR